MDICDRGYLRIIHCDLASIESIKNCAQQLYQCYDRIDFLVNNAGIRIIKCFAGLCISRPLCKNPLRHVFFYEIYLLITNSVT